MDTPRRERMQLERRLGRAMGRCIAEHSLIEDGDRVMVCVSGGKDSYALLELLERNRRRAPVDFSLLAVHLDQGHPGYDGAPLVSWLEDHGFEHRVLRRDTYSIVTDKLEPGSTYCSLCSRLRRGILYRAAQELGCTKIALGHHREDALETLMLNLVFAGRIESMPAHLTSDDGRNTVIRPLLYCDEPTLARYAELVGFPILPCDLCGSQDGLRRQEMKALLADLEGRAPRAKESMLAALQNVRASQLLDPTLRNVAPAIAPAMAPAIAPNDTANDAVGVAPTTPEPHDRRRLPLLPR